LQAERTFEGCQSGFCFRLPITYDFDGLEICDRSGVNILWQFDGPPSGRTVERIEYGVVPAGMREKVAAKPLQVGDRILVRMGYERQGCMAIICETVTSGYEVLGPNRFRLCSKNHPDLSNGNSPPLQ
jgi:hypothetical protein